MKETTADEILALKSHAIQLEAKIEALSIVVSHLAKKCGHDDKINLEMTDHVFNRVLQLKLEKVEKINPELAAWIDQLPRSLEWPDYLDEINPNN